MPFRCLRGPCASTLTGWGLVLAIWSSALGCTVDAVPATDMPDCQGPNCDVDAAASAAPPLSALDAAAPVQPASSDAAAAPAVQDLCPGECSPDAPALCAESFSASPGLQLSLAPAQVVGLDAGVEVELGVASLDAGVPALDASSDSVDAALADAAVNPGFADDAVDEAALPSDGGDAGAQAKPPGELDVVPVDSGMTPTEPGEQVRACQLVPDGAGVVATCGTAGAGEKDSACNSSSDCAPGLACVGDLSNIGSVCLPLCCSGDSSCEERFCGQRPLKSLATEGEPPLVPVCVQSEQCDLTDPYPCADGNCKCPAGSTCAPVGRDGARHCIRPGAGLSGDACPCAAGYFCSAQQQCLKLCQLGSETCGDGSCQATGGFPEQWGLCLEAPTRARSAP